MTRTPAPRSAQTPAPQITLLFIGLMLAMLLAALNQTVLSTALPTIVGELDGVDLMPWVITSYILTSTIVMPLYGRVGDQIGRRSLLVAAILLFMIGSVIGALAQNIDVLIIGRGVQGLGGGGLMLLSQAIIADVVPARDRGKYMGIMGSVFAVSSVAGPLLGGWLTEGPGWRWAFWISMPLGVLALFAAWKFMNLPKHSSDSKPRIDYVGMGLISVATTCLVLASTWGGSQYEWGSSMIIGLFIGAAVTGALFVWNESKAAEPIIPLHLFKDRNFNLTTAAGLLTGVAMFGVLGYLPTYLQMSTGVSATAAGLLMTPMMGAMLITSVVSGIYVSRTGTYKWLPIVGSVLMAVAMTLMSTMTVSSPVWVLCIYIAILGTGLGTSMQLLVLIVQNSFPTREVGTATAANNYFRQVGASLGSAIVGNFFAMRLMNLLADQIPPEAAAGMGGEATSLTPEMIHNMPEPLREIVVGAYNEALIPIFLFMVPLGVLAAVLLAFVREIPLRTTVDDSEPVLPAEGTEASVEIATEAAEIVAEGEAGSASGPETEAVEARV